MVTVTITNSVLFPFLEGTGREGITLSCLVNIDSLVTMEDTPNALFHYQLPLKEKSQMSLGLSKNFVFCL